MQSSFTPPGPAGTEITERLIGRAMINPTFRAQLLIDPTAAAGSIGLSISQEQAARIMSVDQATMNELAARFDAALGSGVGPPMTLEGTASIW